MSELSKKPTIVIAGAGSIGCFVGGMMAHHGVDVRFLARPRIASELLGHGLKLTDYSGFDAHLLPEQLKIATDPSVLREADIILVTVKSGATTDIGNLIREYAPSGMSVVSLQNGVKNGDVLRSQLPDFDVRAGMVAYNVVHSGGGHFHRGTSGDIMIEAGASNLGNILFVPQLNIIETAEIISVQWGKLLINLNNALNALSGKPLLDQLSDRQWRKLMADQFEEALSVMKTAGISPKSATPLPTQIVPMVLRFPTPLFKIISGRTLKIDPSARSSMWEDLEHHRMTEIDELQGVVVELAQKQGIPVPLCARVSSLIKEAEAKQLGSPLLSPEEIRDGLARPARSAGK